MEEKIIELKPCPFCPPDLSKPIFIPYNETIWSHEIYWKVTCLTCGCSCGQPEATQEDAAEVWNTRPDGDE